MSNFINVFDKKTFYKTEGIDSLKETILFLHGWGGNLDSFNPIFFGVKDAFNVISLDLWGFGQSDKPNDWGVSDYSLYVLEFLRLLNIKKTHIICHSFGGRIALLLAQTTIVDKLVLVDSAGIKPRFSILKKCKVFKYKVFKMLNKLGLNFNLTKFGSSDFKQLEKCMKNTFLKVINEDLSACAKNIKTPTLLIWGEKDKDTPLYMAKKLNKYIKNSGLVIFENGEHFCYLYEYNRFILIVKNFFGA